MLELDKEEGIECSLQLTYWGVDEKRFIFGTWLVLNVLICYMIPNLFPLLFPPFLHVAWQFWDAIVAVTVPVTPLSLYSPPLQCAFCSSLSRERPISCPLILGWPCVLHWPIEWDASDFGPILSPRLKRPWGLALFQPLGGCASCKPTWASQLANEIYVEESQQPSASQPPNM